MRQLLVLGFYCEVFKREPICRVYANGVLIDEFNIAHTPRTDALELDAGLTLDKTFWSKEEFLFKSNTPFLKLIEFDDVDSKFLDLRVEIQNDDNNYSNGFMNKYTSIMLCQCWLASVKIWDEFEQIQNRWRFSLPNRHRCVGRSISVAQYYSGSRNHVLDNFAQYADLNFPDITQQSLTNERLFNHKHMPRMWKEHPDQYWIGSTGYYYLPLKKKLGFWKHRDDRRRGWCKWSLVRNLQNLYHKYRSNEDTRSTDQ